MLMKPIHEVSRLEARNQTLEDAARCIERYGFVQGQYATLNGRHCAVGAIQHVARTPEAYTDAIQALANEIGWRTEEGITMWNDEILFFPSIRVRAAIRRAKDQPL